MLASEGVDQFQIVQVDYKEVIVKVVLTNESSQDRVDKLRKRVVEQYKNILGKDMNIVVEVVDQIPTTRDGKRRVVVSKLPIINEQYAEPSS